MSLGKSLVEEIGLVPSGVEWVGTSERPSFPGSTNLSVVALPTLDETCRRACRGLSLAESCAQVQKSNAEKAVFSGEMFVVNGCLIPLCRQPFIRVPENSNSVVNLN